MMKKYRICASHCGDAPEKDEMFLASSDEEAEKKFEEKRRHPSYGMGTVWMERIDQEEKTTMIIPPI